MSDVAAEARRMIPTFELDLAMCRGKIFTRVVPDGEPSGHPGARGFEARKRKSPRG